jgi:ATPase family AAA domain-containing protein 3A/B
VVFQEALALSQQQEITRQQEQMVKVKEYEASIEQMKIEGKRVEGEQRRKYLEEEARQVITITILSVTNEHFIIGY